MREHLYRAKRKRYDEWVEGYYVCHSGRHFIYTGYAETDCGNYYPEYYEVVAETLCEFTGLTDKNGKKIFEGDILRDIDGRIYQIKFFEFKWVADIKVYPFSVEFAHLKPCEVIGNIYDNPELLEANK